MLSVNLWMTTCYINIAQQSPLKFGEFFCCHSHHGNSIHYDSTRSKYIHSPCRLSISNPRKPFRHWSLTLFIPSRCRIHSILCFSLSLLPCHCLRHIKVLPSSIVLNCRIVTLWSDAESKGLSIPYTNIALHAAQGPRSRGENSRGSIYMQLEGASHLMSESTANGNNTHGSPEDCGGEDDAANGLVEVHLTPTDDSTCTSPVNLANW